MSVMESYALGKPVIGANIGGIPELIREGETGITFESVNVESLSNALIQIKQMKDSAVIKMGKAARQWVEAEYTIKKYSERLQNFYLRLGVKNERTYILNHEKAFLQFAPKQLNKHWRLHRGA